MDVFTLAAAFVFGAIIGSFLNVVIARYNTGMGLQGRSMCFSCGATLKWYELLPLASFVVQRGRCRSCGSRISWRYPAVELMTAVVFMLIFMKETASGSWASMAYFMAMFALLIVIAIYDLRHKIIPDAMAYSFAGLSFARLFVDLSGAGGHLFVVPTLWQLLAGPALFLPFFLLWAGSRGRWIGLGDGKLALGIGWFLGLLYGGSAVIFAFWIGAVASVFLILLSNGRLGLESELPFAPFIILAVFLVYYTGISINDVIAFFQNYSL